MQQCTCTCVYVCVCIFVWVCVYINVEVGVFECITGNMVAVNAAAEAALPHIIDGPGGTLDTEHPPQSLPGRGPE